jgi:hypothetical protein
MFVNLRSSGGVCHRNNPRTPNLRPLSYSNFEFYFTNVVSDFVCAFILGVSCSWSIAPAQLRAPPVLLNLSSAEGTTWALRGALGWPQISVATWPNLHQVRALKLITLSKLTFDQESAKGHSPSCGWRVPKRAQIRDQIKINRSEPSISINRSEPSISSRSTKIEIFWALFKWRSRKASQRSQKVPWSTRNRSISVILSEKSAHLLFQATFRRSGAF